MDSGKSNDGGKLRGGTYNGGNAPKGTKGFVRK